MPKEPQTTVVGDRIITEPTFYPSVVGRHLNQLLGEVLTLIDASIIEPTQRKAVKDMIKEKFYRTAYDLKGEERVNLIATSSRIAMILNTGSRVLDPDLDNKPDPMDR